MGVEGVERVTAFNPRLPVTFPSDHTIFFKHRFVYMSDCPFYLFGQNIISLLNMSLSFLGFNLQIVTPDSVITSTDAVAVKQYPLSELKKKGIDSILDILIKQGVVKPFVTL